MDNTAQTDTSNIIISIIMYGATQEPAEGSETQLLVEQQQHRHQYPLSPRRWVALGCLCTVGGINSAQQMNWAALTKSSKEFLGLDDEQLDSLVWCFYLSFVVFSFFSVSCCEKYGIRAVLLVASVCTSVSALVKLVAIRWYDGYYTLILAQIIAALGQPFYMPLPPVMAVVWFSEDTRAIATSVAALCTALGTAFGMAYSPAIVTGGGNTKQWVTFLTIQAVCSCIETAVNIMWNEEEPEHAPSAAAALRRQEAHKHHQISLLRRMKQMFVELVNLFRNKDRALCLIGGGCVIGTLYCVPAAMCQLFAQWSISNSKCGIISGCIILVGAFIVGPAAGLHVDKTKAYRKTLLISVVVGLVGLLAAGFLIFLASDQVILIGATVTIAGAPLLAAFGIAMDAAAEETFPASEVFSSTAVVFVACVLALIEMNTVPAILSGVPVGSDTGKMRACIVWGIFFVVMLVGAVCIWLWEPQLPRQKFEQQQNAEADAAYQNEERERGASTSSVSMSADDAAAK